MRILITGGAGFQGSHLTERLLKKKHAVTVLNTPSVAAVKNLAPFRSRIEVVWGSITDPEIVAKSVRDQDVVFHLAAYVNVDESLLHPESIIATNVMGSVNVLNAVRQAGNRLILVSSCEAYGDGHAGSGVLKETAELRPNSPYAASKAAVDRIAHAYHKSFGLDVTIIRPFNIFGERQKSGKFGALIPKMVASAMAGNDLTVFGEGKQKRDYTYISDIINAYNLILARKDLSGKVINVGSGKNARIIDIATYIAKKFGVKVVHTDARPGEVNRFIGDSAYVKSLGWSPRINLYIGIDRYITWAKTSV